MTKQTLDIITAWEHAVTHGPTDIIYTPEIEEIISNPKVIDVFAFPIAIEIALLGGTDHNVDGLCALIEDALANGVSLGMALGRAESDRDTVNVKSPTPTSPTSPAPPNEDLGDNDTNLDSLGI